MTISAHIPQSSDIISKEEGLLAGRIFVRSSHFGAESGLSIPLHFPFYN